MAEQDRTLLQQLTRHPSPGDRGLLEELRRTAETARNAGNHFGAGYALERALFAAWGLPDEPDICVLGALEAYATVYTTDEPCTIRSITAMFLASQLLFQRYLSVVPETEQVRRARELRTELGERLVHCFANTDGRDNYLVRGFIVETDFDQRFEVELPEYEVDSGISMGGQEGFRFNLPSAFQVFRYEADYDAARSIIEACPDAFTTPGLRGWRAGVLGTLDPSVAPERFAEAADAFAEDRPPTSDSERAERGGHWSNINLETWSPYFRVRSLLATAVGHPARARELITRAAEAADPEAGSRTAPNVRRLALLARSLAELLKPDPELDVAEVRQNFLRIARIADGDDTVDEVAASFVSLASDAFDGFRRDPVLELTRGRLAAALEALRRLPFVDPGVPEAISPALGEHAKQLIEGPIRTRTYRALEAITDERELQHIVYRLCQASLPLYAQVLHGPLEYGKDVVVYFEQLDSGARVLRMYQVKLGDISVSDWRHVRSQLEDMYLVPLATIAVPEEPEPRREGVLICNGHASPSAQPVMDGWFGVQRNQLGREFRFMGIDDIVQWIERERLTGDFRAALRDLGKPETA
jgi:hypothetical protein